jgi:thiol:disulfide interchange protein DsbA
MKLKSLFASVLLAGISMLAQAQEFPSLVEGKDYLKSQIKETVVDANQKKPVLVEFFWYGCPHCFKMKPMAEKLSEKYNGKITSVRYPVGFPNWESGARIFFTLEEMKLLDKLHSKTFEEIQVSRVNILADQTKRDSFFAANGVDVKQFNSTYNSFSVSNKWNKAKNIVTSHKIEGSPVYAVYSGGYTYQVLPSLTGSYEKTIENLDKILAAKSK